MDDRALTLVGRITLIWAQIDFQIDGILMGLHGIDADQLESLFGSSTVGRKITGVKRAVHRAANQDVRAALTAFCEATATCIADRNLMTHGMWGWVWNEEGRWEACAVNHRRKNALSVDQLEDLHERVVAAALKADEAHSLITTGTSPPETRNRAVAYSPFPPETAPCGPPPRYDR
ncbi:MAG TPA: hypothetical protein VK614_15370 [Allosphingosinicella sp.]|nr:hypothetical protein [Allosphingosinicella sp.]